MSKKRGNIEQYCSVMEEVKKRDLVIRAFLSNRSRTLYKATTLECICLQFRKILELIALGSLVVNKHEFSKYHSDFHRYWHGGRILNDLERINAEFYPRPIKETPHAGPNIKSDWTDIKTGYLTKRMFINVYEKCGKILHADNPFGSRTDYSYYEKQAPEWLEKTIRLLNSHIIRLSNDKNLYLIHMKEGRDEAVHAYTFAKKQ